MSTPTRATTFQALQPKPKAPSRIVSASTKSDLNKADIPPPPHLDARATDFQCPYCCVLIPRNILAPRLWRDHVIADLKPYICLEPDCANPDTVFDTQQDWIEHQKWNHSTEYWCQGEDGGHTPIAFQDSRTYAAHLRSYHGVADPNTAATRSATVGRPSLDPFNACPLCDFLPESMTHDGAEQERVSVSIRRQRELQKHIVNEMLNVFLLALPDRDDLQEMGSITDTVGRKRSTADALSNLSLRFQDDTDYDSDTGQDHSYDAASQLVLRSGDVPLCNPDLCTATWAKVWNSPLLEDSVRRAYKGIEQDELLRRFVSETSIVADVVINEKDYKIAWVISEPAEYSSACEVFDETFSVTPTAPKLKAPVFSYGRIGHHFVVIMRPSASWESSSLQMMRTIHPNIQLMFMLGVAHVASRGEHDVEIGDVVVGVPTDNFPAVANLDFGLGGEMPEAKQATMEPPPTILAAISRIRASAVSSDLDEETDRNAVAEFGSKSDDTSLLAETAPLNAANVTEDFIANPGGRGERWSLFDFQSVQSTVHYRPVAIMTVLGRTEAGWGRDPLCLWSVAARHIDSTPGVLIHGIWSSQHDPRPLAPGQKQKVFDAAIIYAKLLLEGIPTSLALTASDDTNTWQRLMTSLQFDGMLNTDDAIEDPYPGTCQWFFETPEYKRWIGPLHLPQDRQGLHPKLLQCSGGAATGKSTLFKVAVEHVQQTVSEALVVSFAFNTTDDKLVNSIKGMCRSLLYQMLQRLSEVQNSVGVQELVAQHFRSDLWNIEHLKLLLKGALSHLRTSHIVCFIDLSDIFTSTVNAWSVEAILAEFGSFVCVFSRRHFPLPSIYIQLENQPGHATAIAEVYAAIQDRPAEAHDVSMIGRYSGHNFLWAKAAALVLHPATKTSTLPIAPEHLSTELQSLLCYLMFERLLTKMSRKYDAIELLIQSKYIDVNAQEITGEKLLIRAIQARDGEAIRLLLKHPSIDTAVTDMFGRTALMAAIRVTLPYAIELLLIHANLNVNAEDKAGSTSLLMAAKDGYLPGVELLLTHPDIDVNARTLDTRQTALIIATIQGRGDIVELLLKHQATDINAKGTFGGTALTVASTMGQADVVTLLLTHPQIDVNARDVHFRTPLFNAARETHLEVIDLLLARPDTDINARDIYGVTAYYVALEARTKLGSSRSISACELFEKHPRGFTVPDHV